MLISRIFFDPPAWLTEIAAMGNVATEECYKTWCMGNGMLIVVDPNNAQEAITHLKKSGIEAKVAGEITEDPAIIVHAHDKSILNFR